MSEEKGNLVRPSRERLIVELGFINPESGDEYTKECRSKRITPRLLKNIAEILATIDIAGDTGGGLASQYTIEFMSVNKKLAGKKDIKLSEIKVPKSIKALPGLKAPDINKMKAAIIEMLKNDIVGESDIVQFGNRVEFMVRAENAAKLFRKTIDRSELSDSEIELIDNNKIKVGDETITFDEIQGINTISDYVNFFRRISQNAQE